MIYYFHVTDQLANLGLKFVVKLGISEWQHSHFHNNDILSNRILFNSMIDSVSTYFKINTQPITKPGGAHIRVISTYLRSRQLDVLKENCHILNMLKLNCQNWSNTGLQVNNASRWQHHQMIFLSY
jgi:hypothetical protein